MAPPSPLLAVPNVTTHPSTATVPITVLLYDGPLLCGSNVAIKGLSQLCNRVGSDQGNPGASYPFYCYSAAEAVTLTVRYV